MQLVHVIARRLHRAPDDEGAWLVFADWLLERGDPRGAYLTLLHRLAQPGLGGHERLGLERRLRELAPPTEEDLLEELDLHGMWWVINVLVRRGFIFGLTLAWMRDLTLDCLDRVASHPAGVVWSEVSVSGLGAADAAALVERDALVGRSGLDISQPRAYKARVGAKGAATLAGARRLSHLETLRIGGNGIGPEGAIALAESGSLTDLTCLDLAANGLDDRGIADLAARPGLGRLTDLGLADNPFGPAGLLALARSEHVRDLARLDLRLTELGAHSAPAWRALDSVNLRELCVDATGLKAEGTAGLAASPALAGVRTLSAASNELGDDGAIALARSPHVGNLERLVLVHDQIGARGMAALLGASGTTSLHTLDLDHNRIGPRGLRGRPSAAFVRVVDLHLANNALGDEGVRALARMPFSRLRSLRLRGNHLGDAAAAALARSPHLGTLTHLDLRDNHISDRGATALASAQSLGNLVQLDLRQNQLGPRGILALQRSRQLPALERFRR